jgi:arylsulfatase A-like enzyme
VQAIAAISYLDVLFAAALSSCGYAAVSLARGRPLLARALSMLFVAIAAVCCLYAVAGVIVFGALGGFVTYPLLALIGDVRMVRSSVAAHLTGGAAAGLFGVPLLYASGVVLAVRMTPARRFTLKHRVAACALLLGWSVFGNRVFTQAWASRADRRIAENAHWVLLSSWWETMSGNGGVRMTERFLTDDLADFEPLGVQRAVRTGPLNSVVQRASMRRTLKGAAYRPPNVILIVLESVAARWVSLNNGLYDTTPVLKTESATSAVFDNFYAHIGRSSNSLGTMLLSQFPKLDFRDLTEEYPRLPGTSLASLFQDQGYRTAFLTPSDLKWAGWDSFLKGRGFSQVRDYHDLACGDPISSWGVEDRCAIDAILPYLDISQPNPFFVMAWTTQTHHPYEPTPGVPLLNLVREPVFDDWDLGRYLNVLHETDRHLGRLFDEVRRAGLDQNTLIVVTGDHGQAFGYPHETYIQGRTVYEEDVHVPLMFWFPRAYPSPVHSKTVGSHVDLAPTIANVVGLPPAPDWQGRSLLDASVPHRAYFYVAEDQFTLGVREGNWKYMLSLRDGVEELYDLDRDPHEQHNIAAEEPQRCVRLRQRLAAWTEANRRQYERAAPGI